MIVNDRSQSEVHVVLGHADLSWHFNDLNFDVDLDEILRQWVDLDQSRIDCACESAKLGHQADISLGDWLVWLCKG